MNDVRSRITRLLTLLAMVCAIWAPTVSCGPPPPAPCPTSPAPNGLAIAVGNRTNSPEPFWPAELDAEITKVADAAVAGEPRQGVTLVRADGTPTIGCAFTYDASAKTDGAKASDREQFAGQVENTALVLRADSPEADPLAALSQASAAAGPGGTVALLDSGLSTVAPLDFREDGLLGKDVDWVVAALAQGGLLPDLKGKKVILAGIGYTAEPQPALAEPQRAHLIELWQRIVTAAGAAEVVVVSTPNTNPAQSGLPDVSEVPVPPPGKLTVACDHAIPLQDDGDVGFRPGTVDFRDGDRALAALNQIADWLAQNPIATARVEGSIAHHGVDEGDSGLSRDRAVKVRDVLVELGAGSGQVTAMGTGWGPFPSKTAPPDDTNDPRNRRVLIRLACG